MIGSAQLILIAVVVALAVLLFILFIQAFFALRDFQKTLKRFNRLLDDADELTKSIATPIGSVSSVLMGLRTGSALGNLLKKLYEELSNKPSLAQGIEVHTAEVVEDTKREEVKPKKAVKKSEPRRFFKRSK